MVVLNASQIRAWDAYTISEGVSPLELVERAASGFVDMVDLLLGDEDQEVLIICGNGNNGADGLAIAYLLIELDYLVDVYVNLDGPHTSEWKTCYERLVQLNTEQLEIHTTWNPEKFQLSPSGTIIDAMFGTGLKRPLEGQWRDIAVWLNEQNNLTIAVDMPSGLYADRPPDGIVVFADLVITFQGQRLAFMMPESDGHFSEVIVCPIGLSDTFLLEHEIRSFELTHYYLMPFLQERLRFSHKGDFGHGLLVAGSMGMAGASILSSGAAMRSGIGMLTLQVPQLLYAIVQSAVPEAMVILDEHDRHISNIHLPEKITAVGIGPGIGQHADTVDAIEGFLNRSTHLPMVWDADALNILAIRKDLLDKLPEGTIITPHPGEFDRLFGEQDDHYTRLETAIREAQNRNINIVLKGCVTAICLANGVTFFNTRGNPGMATAGSGDVLTGIILGLLCQGYTPDYAAMLGVYLHATAGDIAAEDMGIEALVAGDLIAFLGDAYNDHRRKEQDVKLDEGEKD